MYLCLRINTIHGIDEMERDTVDIFELIERTVATSINEDDIVPDGVNVDDQYRGILREATKVDVLGHAIQVSYRPASRMNGATVTVFYEPEHEYSKSCTCVDCTERRYGVLGEEE
jgi:hypothetical protein